MKTITKKFRASTLVAACALILSAATIGWKASAQTPPPPPAPPAPLTGTWTIDPAHTSVTFSISHFGISEVHGRFDSMSGTIIANAKHPEQSSVTFTIDASSINTDQSMRDGDLKGSSYFDVSKYPTITFVSTSVSKTGKGQYVATGNLTMHGVTKGITLPFTLGGPISVMGSSRIGVVSSITLQRLDYGIGPSLPIIGLDVPIDISVEATPAATPRNNRTDGKQKACSGSSRSRLFCAKNNPPCGG